jgi:hypothetical protein
MSDDGRRRVTEPGELVYRPGSSWLPVFLAFALCLAAVGVYIEFMVAGWIFSVIGLVTAALVFRSMTRDSVADYYRLRRKQRVRGAVLPVETITPPKR